VPQGTFESQARGKSHVRLAVFTILAIHVVVLGALLIQGCKRDGQETTANDTSSMPTNDFSSVPPFAGSNDLVTSPAPSSTSAPASPFATPPVTPATGLTASGSTPTSAPMTVPPFVPSVPPTTPAPMVANNFTEGAAPTEHVIVKGDTFDTLRIKYGVTVRAIQNANPDVNPTRLKIGQKVKIPAKSGSATTTALSSGGGVNGAASDIYMVKSGDTLGKIAAKHGTTARELQRLNNLSTTQIRVGQKLKLPSRGGTPATATPTPAAPGGLPPTGGSPAPFPAPAQ
jgi:LysM repeat protein